MPITNAAKKALRQTAKKAATNRIIKAEIETLKKKVKKAIEAANENEAKELWQKLQKRLDKAAKTGLFKKNTADRVKSRLKISINKTFAKK